MQINRFHYTALIILSALLGGAWIIFSQEPVTGHTNTGGLVEGPQAGLLAPNFTLTTLDGVEVNLHDFQGQPVMINFWATWCPPCRAEMPHIQAASENYDGRVAFLAVNQGETQNQISNFATDFGLTFPLLVDSNSQVNRTYGISALPTTIFVDKNGVVDELFAGTLNQAVLEDRLNKLLQE